MAGSGYSLELTSYSSVKRKVWECTCRPTAAHRTMSESSFLRKIVPFCQVYTPGLYTDNFFRKVTVFLFFRRSEPVAAPHPVRVHYDYSAIFQKSRPKFMHI